MRYFVESYGCTMNVGEGRKLSADLASLGHVPAESADDAELVVLNTCTVVDTTEKRMISRISELKKQGKEIIVTGCMAKAQPKRVTIRLPDSIVLPPDRYGSFQELVTERYGAAGGPVALEQPYDAILPIAQGCPGNCSYCITKLARGDLRSYRPERLTSDFSDLISKGAREVLLTAQDTAAYGRDLGTDLPALVHSMLETDGEFRVRIGMMNPHGLSRIWEDLMPLFDDRRMYRFLHIPVQSASDEVLRRMRRPYTIGGFLELVDDIRAACPDVSIATDMICGFPGETDGDHTANLELIRRLRADTVNITRFSVRPGTDAAGMEQVTGRISKERSAELTAAKNETEMNVNSTMVGRTYEALATEKGKDGTILRTGNYRPVVVRDDVPIGTFVRVEVTESRPTYLLGELVG